MTEWPSAPAPALALLTVGIIALAAHPVRVGFRHFGAPDLVGYLLKPTDQWLMLAA